MMLGDDMFAGDRQRTAVNQVQLLIDKTVEVNAYEVIGQYNLYRALSKLYTEPDEEFPIVKLRR